MKSHIPGKERRTQIPEVPGLSGSRHRLSLTDLALYTEAVQFLMKLDKMWIVNY